MPSPADKVNIHYGHVIGTGSKHFPNTIVVLFILTIVEVLTRDSSGNGNVCQLVDRKYPSLSDYTPSAGSCLQAYISTGADGPFILTTIMLLCPIGFASRYIKQMNIIRFIEYELIKFHHHQCS